MTEWQLLDLHPVNDKRAIKRAYAKKIKTIDPTSQPGLFQEVREAYEYLCDYGRHYVDDNPSIEIEEPSVQFDDFEQPPNESVEKREASKNAQANSLNLDQTDGVALTLEPSQSSSSSSSSSSSNDSNSIELESIRRPNSSEVQIELSVSDATDSNRLEPESLLSEDNSPLDPVSTGQHLDLFIENDHPEELAERFINLLESSFDEHVLDVKQWINFLADEELQYIDVTNILRFRCFEFFVKIINARKSVGEPIQVTLRSLPEGIKPVIQYYARYFDWKHSEFLLSDYFSLEEMQLLSHFYQPTRKSKVIDSEKPKESWTGTTLFFWIILLFGLAKAFSGLDNGVNNHTNRQPEEANKIDFLANLSDDLCYDYLKIRNDIIANRCQEKLSVGDNVERFNLAFYWLMKYQERKQNYSNDSTKEQHLDLAISLLEEAKVEGYLPAIKLLAGISLSDYYQRKDLSFGLRLLQEAARKMDYEAISLLGANHYLGVWGEKNIEQSKFYFEQLPSNPSALDHNQRFVLATAYWLELKEFKVNYSSHTRKTKAKEIFLKASEKADIRYLNEVSWYFATTTNVQNDPVLALQLSEQMGSTKRQTKDWRYLDTIAVSYAANGQFIQATETVNQAILLFEEAKLDLPIEQAQFYQDDFSKRLALFGSERKVEVDSNPETLARVFGFYLNELMKVDL
jgi:hypothetical protein